MIEKHGGSTLLQAGWPHLLLQRKSDRHLYAVEVKSDKDRVSKSQSLLFAALQRGGVFVFIWNPKRPTTLSKWSDYNDMFYRQGAEQQPRKSQTARPPGEDQ
jgi:hypothetical protein